MTRNEAEGLATSFIEFLETGTVPEGLFASNVFCDFTMPKWRLQAAGIDGVVALRKAGHPGPGRVPRWRTDATANGFVLEFEERWEQDGTDWYSREMARGRPGRPNHGALGLLHWGLGSGPSRAPRSERAASPALVPSAPRGPTWRAGDERELPRIADRKR